MGRKVDPREHARARPKLTVDDLEGNDATVLMLESVEEVKGTEKKYLVMKFQETGDKVLYPNVSSVRFIIEFYGDDLDDWVGQPIAVHRSTGTYNDKAFENVQVPAPESWPEIFRGLGMRAPTPRNAPAPPPVKRGGVVRGARRGKRA